MRSLVLALALRVDGERRVVQSTGELLHHSVQLLLNRHCARIVAFFGRICGGALHLERVDLHGLHLRRCLQRVASAVGDERGRRVI